MYRLCKLVTDKCEIIVYLFHLVNLTIIRLLLYYDYLVILPFCVVSDVQELAW